MYLSEMYSGLLCTNFAILTKTKVPWLVLNDLQKENTEESVQSLENAVFYHYDDLLRFVPVFKDYTILLYLLYNLIKLNFTY